MQTIHPITPQSTAHAAKRVKTRFVVWTFCASLVSFFAAGFYDYIRPVALYRFVVHAENALLWSSHNFCHADGSAGPLDSVDGPPAYELPVMVRVVVRTVVEASILVPTLLLIMPLTHRKWRQLRKVSGDERQSSNEDNKLCLLLRRTSWVLWTLSAIGLVLGIVVDSHQFGIISVSALLAFFAQGVHCVGFLVSSYDSGDIHQESCSIDLRADHKIPAVSWVRRKSGFANVDYCKEAINPHQAKNAPDDNPIRKDLPPEKSSNSMNWSLEAGPKRESSDLLLFFFIKLALLQTPYCLHLGLHLLHDCVACALQHRKQFDPTLHLNSPGTGGDFILPREIPALVAFACTILVPLFTHGVGGKLFNGTRWSFHHPFDGGQLHVKCQATGWSLVGLAGFLQLAFMMLGMGRQYVYLLHSGSLLSWLAEGILLYSLLDFRPTKVQRSSVRRNASKSNGLESTLSIFLSLMLSFTQDFVITNLHWLLFSSMTMSLLGFNFFSLHPTKCFLCASPADVAFSSLLLLVSWVMPYVLVSYSPRRKRWKWNVFGLTNDAFAWFVCQPHGLFSGSQLKMEGSLDDYQRPGAMYCLAPHGTLPTSVVAIIYQFEHIFADVCVFFGSQLDLCPGYRFFFGMRGGFLPVEKPRLVSRMQTGQSVALVPGGVSEMLHCVAHEKAINVSIKHKGFVRLAIQHGYDLIPTFLFHANDQYNNPMRKIQMWTYKVVGVPIGLPLFTNRWGLPFSNRTKIRVALGRRIAVAKNPDPTAEEVDQLHREFYEEVLMIWQQHKDEFGYSDRELCFIT